MAKSIPKKLPSSKKFRGPGPVGYTTFTMTRKEIAVAMNEATGCYDDTPESGEVGLNDPRLTNEICQSIVDEATERKFHVMFELEEYYQFFEDWVARMSK